MLLSACRMRCNHCWYRSCAVWRNNFFTRVACSQSVLAVFGNCVVEARRVGPQTRVLRERTETNERRQALGNGRGSIITPTTGMWQHVNEHNSWLAFPSFSAKREHRSGGGRYFGSCSLIRIHGVNEKSCDVDFVFYGKERGGRVGIDVREQASKAWLELENVVAVERCGRYGDEKNCYTVTKCGRLRDAKCSLNSRDTDRHLAPCYWVRT